MNKDKQIRFGTGEILSFEKFFKENFSKFYAFTVRFVEDSYICEDLVQEEYMFSSVLDEEAHYVLYEAIRCLTPQCQTVIKLHLGGKKNKEIAEEMGISVITVKSHKMMAYKELRKILAHSVSLILLVCVNSVKKNQF